MCNPEAVYPTCTVSETNLKLSSAECRKTEHSSKFSNSLIAFFKVAKQKKKKNFGGSGLTTSLEGSRFPDRDGSCSSHGGSTES